MRAQFINHPERVHCKIKNGVVLVGSDAHYWPGKPSTGHKAFVKFAKKLSPQIIILNGDAFDGARISRHPPIGWEKRPQVIEELEVVQERLQEIELAAPKSARLVWPLGNHDARFETRLATIAPEYARVHGFHLKDHMGARWEPCWSCWVNSDVVVKHRFRGGAHSTHNNTVAAGKTMVTGHLHAAKITPYTDYNGTRYGIDTGCLADPNGPQFGYSEDNPRNHRSGFVVLTFKSGKLLQPELALVWDKHHIQFRGELVEV